MASIVTLLEPLTATVLATTFLGERLTPAALLGGLLVLGAVAALHLPAAPPPHRAGALFRAKARRALREAPER